ncbi:MAG: cysteine--tRNA ligase, partial [Devosia sp.]
LDLIFPHHENEIAQSRCAHGTHAMANVWMHNGFLQVEGQKMSKSVGNFITISQLLETGDFGGRQWPGEVLRLAMLMTHYREPIDFTVKRLEEAHALWLGWRNAVRRHSPDDGVVIHSVVEALRDDLNTPLAIMALSAGKAKVEDLVATLNFLGLIATDDVERIRSARKAQNEGVHDAVERAFAKMQLVELHELGLQEPDLEAAIAERLAAFNARDFARADAIRAELAAQGITLMDSKDASGARQTKWEIKR